jgi:hypothetical protein
MSTPIDVQRERSSRRAGPDVRDRPGAPAVEASAARDVADDGESGRNDAAVATSPYPCSGESRPSLNVDRGSLTGDPSAWRRLCGSHYAADHAAHRRLHDPRRGPRSRLVAAEARADDFDSKTVEFEIAPANPNK